MDGAVLRRVQAEGIPINAAVGLGVFCEPAVGSVDFPGFFAVLREIDFDGWGIIEQDLYPTTFDRPLPIARRSLAYFRGLLERIDGGSAQVVAPPLRQGGPIE